MWHFPPSNPPLTPLLSHFYSVSGVMLCGSHYRKRSGILRVSFGENMQPQRKVPHSLIKINVKGWMGQTQSEIFKLTIKRLLTQNSLFTTAFPSKQLVLKSLCSFTCSECMLKQGVSSSSPKNLHPLYCYPKVQQLTKQNKTKVRRKRNQMWEEIRTFYSCLFLSKCVNLLPT